MDAVTEFVDLNLRIGGLIMLVVVYLMFRDWRKDYKRRKGNDEI